MSAVALAALSPCDLEVWCFDWCASALITSIGFCVVLLTHLQTYHERGLCCAYSFTLFVALTQNPIVC